MYKASRRKRYLLVGNVKEVMANKLARSKYTFTYKSNEDCYYTVDKKKLTIEEFNTLFPIEFKPPAPKGENYDRTKNWLHGDKSY